MFKLNADIFETLSEAIPEGVIVVDKKQEIVATNTSALEMFGYDKEELDKQRLEILIPQRYHRQHGGHFSSFYRNAEKRTMGIGRELFGIKKSGEEFPIEVGLAPFELSGDTFIMALMVDITVRKETEQRILDLNAELEMKVKERTKELQHTVLELQTEVEKRKKAEEKALESLQRERELNELKTKFLSLVSHEFKTPLTGILTSAVLVGKYEKTDHQPKREKHLDLIKNKVHYLDGILNDFLSVERLESGKVNYKISTFQLSKVLNEVIYSANMLLKSGQRINYPENVDEIAITFDEKILTLVLTNLVSNAIKYSPENTVIDIKTTEASDTLLLTVRDQGMGIPKKDQKHVFQRYFRAENATTYQGTGIGLNIIKGHLDNLGGTISFISQEGKGSTFTVELPRTLSKIYS
ncbi:ATP-binding protein [Sungkyunkwania multivorans]|uniref:histidine kinase n=1 Tax=Sungkyunkwania multivorans TaxID=1173618 RepID=A0ABW3D5E3_9FLAO